MTVFRRQKYAWPHKRHTERRLYPRVSLRFPLTLDMGADEPALEGMTIDVGLGGVRAHVDRYLPLYARFRLSMELPLTARDGEVSWSIVSTHAALVRVDPDEPPDALDAEGTTYDVSLAFMRLGPEQEHVLGTFLLQMLLFDPDASVV